jgi:hypothetical protein
MAIHALHIGNNYRGTDYSLPDCELDARMMAADFGTLSLSHELQVGRQASRDGILRAGRAIKSRLAPGDCWVITNSGHGTREKKSGRWVEAIVCDGGELIYDFEFFNLIHDELPAGDKGVVVFAISDSCFSGGLEREWSERIRRTIHIDRCKPHDAIPPRKRQSTSPLAADPYFSACATKEESYSTGKGGAMTLAVHKTMKEQKGLKSFAEMFQRIGGRPHGLLPTDEWPQHPQCEGSSQNMARTLKSFAHAK